jgi:type VI secretion system protein VasD
MRRVRLLLASLVTCACLPVGCGAAPTCVIPDAVQLEIETSDRVNRDERGRSLPTVLRLYQLKDLSKLEQATFEDIWERSAESLGDTLLGAEELTLYPGQVMVHRFQRNAAADFLVGAAVFRSPAGGSWRTIEEWPLPGDPCAEADDHDAAPKFKKLRVRMFLEDYRIESVNNYAALRKRRCPAGQADCSGPGGPDELPEARRNQRLKTFEEDAREPTPTVGPGSRATGEP